MSPSAPSIGPQRDVAASNEGRLVSVDVLRGIAALGVLLFHAADRQTYLIAPNWIGRLMGFLCYWGLLGVYLFFVISGFCIHLKWAQQKAEGKTPKIDLGQFWRRRFRRLYPAYIVSLGLYLLGARLLGNLAVDSFLVVDVIVHLLMLHNIMPATTFSLNGVFWTLAIEEQLYLAYFALLRLRNRLGWARTIALTLVARAAWLALGMFLHRVWKFDITVTESAAALWFCWALGALGVEAYLGVVRLPRWCSSGLCGLGLLALSIAVGTSQRYGAPTGWVTHFRTLISQPLYSLSFFVIMNKIVSMEPWLAQRRGVVHLLSRIGLFSYSLYLTHEIFFTQILPALSGRYGWTEVQRTTIAVFVLVPVSIVFARIFYQFFERPFMSKPSTRSVPPVATWASS